MTPPIAQVSAAAIAAGAPAMPRSVRKFDDAERLDPAGKSIYMIGIGGCGMAGLARMLRTRGGQISGSELSRSAVATALESEGITIGFDQASGRLPELCDLVIASAAIRPDHPQWLEAERRGIPVMLYAEALGRSMIGHTGVAVAGTHGKSTTTAMLGAALADAGLDPTVIVGATCPQLLRGAAGQQPGDPSVGFRLGAGTIPAGALKGRPGLLIAEACEYNRSFLHFRPRFASISSVEADHLDIFGSLGAVVEAFRDFAALVPAADAPGGGGTLLIAHEGAHRREVTAGLDCRIETIGFHPEADWLVTYDARSRRVSLARDRREAASWVMRIPGAHNAMNAATACVLALNLGADAGRIGDSLSSFAGVDRRTQFLGERELRRGGSVRVYDDYGHHPTEVDATLRALREFERPEERSGRLVCVFQPHQHSRTRHLLEEFATSFSQADAVIVPHIYFVRDTQAEKQKVSAADLVDRLREKGVNARHVYPFDAIADELEDTLRPGDLLVVMGAGPVNEVAHKFLSAAPARGQGT